MSFLAWIVAAIGSGALLGALALWLWWRGEKRLYQSKLSEAEQRLAEQREIQLQAEDTLRQTREEIRTLSIQLQESRIALASAEASVVQLQPLREEQARLQQELNRQNGRLAELQERLLQERQHAEEKQQLLSQAEERLRESFAALSGAALRRNNEDFLRLAQENLARFQEQARQDWEGRQTAFSQFVTPLRESLGKMNERLDGLEQVRAAAYSALSEQLRGLVQDHLPRLHRETAALVKALRQPAARGRWGELQLRRVVEMAGMLDHCDFVEQASMQTEQGQQRPDLLVHLPGAKRSWSMPRRLSMAICRPSRQSPRRNASSFCASTRMSCVPISNNWDENRIGRNYRARSSWCFSCRGKISSVRLCRWTQRSSNMGWNRRSWLPRRRP